ncbi:response regulator transcription factor [Luteimonas sp. SJ-92]|uniref:Response regulator transcription factor n=1 Tax=Luteimonas salinisoli TaxID=2752307 RepID=A0A853J8P0_9GAMM|nr:LytTR family DNA-binding domain-containing protein [Luteimonas salinisoli]NZA25556.1 response regulator transcription factor [Luteimonas salinisoli]
MHIVVIEDETVVARRIERLVRRILGPRLLRIDRAGTLRDATRLLARLQDAVVLLDLNLSGDDGFDVLRRAVAEPFQTIVVSANTDRAVEAFELGVVDFVPKPFTEERLGRALDRVGRGGRSGGGPPSFLAVTLAGRVDLVAVGTVVAIHGADDYSEIETSDGRRHLHKKTLTMLGRVLPENFLRVHRSHIVNLRFAEGMDIESGGRRVLHLSNGSSVPVSRSHAGKLGEAGGLP